MTRTCIVAATSLHLRLGKRPASLLEFDRTLGLADTGLKLVVRGRDSLIRIPRPCQTIEAVLKARPPDQQDNDHGPCLTLYAPSLLRWFR